MRAEGTKFVLGENFFFFGGTNNYDLSLLRDDVSEYEVYEQVRSNLSCCAISVRVLHARVCGEACIFAACRDYLETQPCANWYAICTAQVRIHAANGVKVLRFWSYSNGGGLPANARSIQPSVGVYDEAALVRLDVTLAACSYHGVKVIIAFANYEKNDGGIQWVRVALSRALSRAPTPLPYLTCILPLSDLHSAPI